MLQYDIFGDIIETDGFGNPIRHNNADNNGDNASNLCNVCVKVNIISAKDVGKVINMDQYEINWDISK